MHAYQETSAYEVTAQDPDEVARLQMEMLRDTEEVRGDGGGVQFQLRCPVWTCSGRAPFEQNYALPALFLEFLRGAECDRGAINNNCEQKISAPFRVPPDMMSASEGEGVMEKRMRLVA